MYYHYKVPNCTGATINRQEWLFIVRFCSVKSFMCEYRLKCFNKYFRAEVLELWKGKGCKCQRGNIAMNKPLDDFDIP